MITQNNKVLLFSNLMSSPEKKEDGYSYSCGVHYLASSLTEKEIPFIFSDSKICIDGSDFVTQAQELKDILIKHSEINFVCITLSEFYFEKVVKLVAFIRKYSHAFIGVGGIMPTLSPQHVFAHLPNINFLVRGIGEHVLPDIVKILSGKNVKSRISKNDFRRLRMLEGFMFSHRGCKVNDRINIINAPNSYGRSKLTFSFFNKKSLYQGLNLFTSWGCSNNCFFCTNPFKKNIYSKTCKELIEIIGKYYRRLKSVFLNKIPSSALALSFYDDDFLADNLRAVDFFNYLKTSPFKINFFQTGIRSFFKKDNRRDKGFVLDLTLLSSIKSDIFLREKETNIFIGLENFNDYELQRLGKGYSFAMADLLIRALAIRQIKVAYHLILSNNLTTAENIIENLFKCSRYQKLYGSFFKVLTPVIPYLVSLYPSASYRLAVKNKRKKFLSVRRLLTDKKETSLDYPLIDHDIPIDCIAKELVPFVEKLFLKYSDYAKILEETLMFLLYLGKKYPQKEREMSLLIKKFALAEKNMQGKHVLENAFNRNNIQLMVTRRCQLRCIYCPIKKRNQDMSEDVLARSVKLLFTSDKKNLRLDFTGGEPLLRFDLVKRAVGLAKLYAKEKNKNVSFYMVTNLLALDVHMAVFLKNENFFLELSMDGVPGAHNFYKIPFKSSLDPYQQTSKNLKIIFSNKIVNHAVLVTGPVTSKNLFNNFSHLIHLGFRDVSINYALCSYWSRNSFLELIFQLERIKRVWMPYIKKGVIRLGNLQSRQEPAIFNTELLVDVDGQIRFLTDELFQNSRTKQIPSLGLIEKFKKLDEIPFTKIKSVERLFYYNRKKKIIRIILNNIEIGEALGKYFDEWKN
jgi:sulfatase maturation enzyme AslB (radical SAM superfamily)